MIYLPGGDIRNMLPAWVLAIGYGRNPEVHALSINVDVPSCIDLAASV